MEAQLWQMRQLLSHATTLHWRHVLNPTDRITAQVPKKLVLRLGYCHPIEFVLPPTVTVTQSSPSDFVLSGPHAKQLYTLAVSIREKRKPEPYKGKGVFVDGETIIIKQKKLK